MRAQVFAYARPLLRTLAAIAILLAAVAALTLGAVVLVLRNETANRWALEAAQRLLPELTVEAPRGNLIDGLHADALRWEDPDLELVLAPLDLRLSWANLLRGRITVAPLRIGRLTIHPRGPGDDAPVSLPALIAPLPLHVPQLSIGELVIRSGDTVTTLTNLRARARWLGPHLRLNDVRLGYEGLALAAPVGGIQFLRDYPLTLQGAIGGEPLPGPATVIAGGDLRGIKLDGRLGGDWPLNVQAVLHVLDTDMPFTLAAQLARPVRQGYGTDAVTFDGAKLKAAGDIERFSGTLTAQLDDTRYGDAILQGTLNWDGTVLAAQSQLALAGGGKVDGDCRLDTNVSQQNASQWSCDGAIAALPLTPWLNGLTGEVSTPFAVGGRLAQPLDLQIALPGIRGKLGEMALTGAVQAHSPDLEHWVIPEATLDAGPNHLRAAGELGVDARQATQLHVQFDAPQLALLYAGLSGAARGRVDIAGALDAPSLRGELALRDVLYERKDYEDIRLQSGSLHFQIDDLGHRPGEVAVALRGLAQGEQRGSVDASWRGTRADHGWRLSALHGEDRLELACRGALAANDERYQLDCATLGGSLAVTARKTVQWGLQAPLRARWDLARNEGGVDAFCLRAETASLCVKPGLQVRQQQVQPFNATLSQLPLRWWQRALAEGLRLRNEPHLNAELRFARQQPLQLQATATLEPSEWRWRTGEEAKTLTLDAVTASADLDGKRAHLALAARAPELGNASAELTVFEPLGARRLQGRVALEHLQLAAFGWAIQDIDALEGRIDGAATIAGTAAQPVVAGEFTLADGGVDVAELGDPIRELGARLRFDNQRADLSGQFLLGAGRAQLDGNALWSAGYTDWRAALHLRGNGLQIEPIAGSKIAFAPNLTFDAVPDDLRLHGEVTLEQADIRLQELPPETVNPSRDAVVSGREAAEAGLPLTLDVTLDLGRRTHFAGFGAEVDLAGQLRLQQQKNRELSANGHVNVTKGRYRAYGQRLLVRKGQFIFTGNLDNPDLNLEAIREFPPGNADVVGLRVTGSLRDPVAQLFSDQSLSESDTAYYLLTGRRPDPNQKTGGFSAGGTLLSLGLARGENQAARLAEKFGIKGLQLGTAAGSDGTTEAEVSGYLFRDLYVRYGRSLGENVDSVTLQYPLSPNLMIQSISGIEEILELIYTFTLD